MFITIPNTDSTGLALDPTSYPIDTPEQIQEARAALRGAGIDQAAVWAGDPDCPDAYQTSGVLSREPTS